MIAHYGWCAMCGRWDKVYRALGNLCDACDGITRTVRLRHVAWPGREDRPTQLEERRLRLAGEK